MYDIDYIKNYLNGIYKHWYLATDKDANDDRIRIGVESDWKCNEAKQLLEKDQTGLLSILCMRSAYIKHINEMSISIKDALSQEWQTKITHYSILKNYLFNNLGEEIYNEFIRSIDVVCKALGREDLFKNNNKLDFNVEDVIAKAVTKFNDGHSFNHDLLQGKFEDLIVNKNITIYKDMFVFDSYSNFIETIKLTPGNLICVSLITNPDDEYDKFFAFGLKNNNVVICVNDREIQDSPLCKQLTRNPGRRFYDKSEYDYLPYYKCSEIESRIKLNNDCKLLTYNQDGMCNLNKNNNIIEICDLDTVAYIAIIIGLIYKKYFIDLNKDLLSDKLYFNKDIKLLPNANYTRGTLVVKVGDELHVNKDSFDIDSYRYNSHASLFHGEEIYNTGYFDYLIDEYPIMNEIKDITLPDTFIGTELDVDRRIWWEMRYKQYKHIMRCLQSNVSDRERDLDKWLYNKVYVNVNRILDYIILMPEKDNMDNYSLNGTDLPNIWELVKDNKPFSTIALRKLEDDINFKEKNHRRDLKRTFESSFELFQNCSLYKLYGGTYAITSAEDAVDKKTVAIRLRLRSYRDMMYMFNLKQEELPKEYKRIFRPRTNSKNLYYNSDYSGPYKGNNILNFTDPMNNIIDPYNENFSCDIILFMSKSFYNRFNKRYNSEFNNMVVED